MDKSKLVIYGAAAAFLVIAVCMFIPEKKTGQEPGQRQKNETANVPDGDTQEVTTSKLQGYERGTSGNRNSAADIYWSSKDESQMTQEELRQSSQEMFGSGTPPSAPAYSSPPASNPYRETPEEREARHRRRQEEAIELAERMTSEETGEVTQEETDLSEEEKSEELPRPVVTRQSSSISTLDDDFSSSGMSSLDDEGSLTISSESQPFKCMFAKESRVKNGQRVSVILLEDIMVGGIPVPKNTHLMARCKLSDRLELEFENIEIGGRILHLGYEAYDVDGSKGIYCPDVSGTGKQVRSRGSNIISSTLSGRMGRIASEVLSSGISIAQSAGGEITVSVPAGYTFYIVKSQK
jgi:hypothetical protein